jgi:phage portal protein BeeE
MAFDFFKRRSGEANTAETKASATGPVIAYHGAGRVAWSARDTVSLTRSGFAGNPVGFRAVKLIAEAAAAVPLVLQNSEQRFETQTFLQLLAAPNAAQGRVEFFVYGVAFREITEVLCHTNDT